MQWIKSHMTIVICGAVSLVSIVLIVLGIVLCDVAEVMGRDRSMAQSLGPGRIRPVNERVINHLRTILDNNTRQVEVTFKKLAELGTHKPLHPDLFPQPASLSVPFRFPDRFDKAQQKMLETLNAGDKPTPDEIAQEEADMEAQRMREQSLEELGGAKSGQDKSVSPFGTTGRSHFDPSAIPKTGRLQDKDRRAGMTPEELAAEFPEVRLGIQQARRIYCYANESSFDPRPGVAHFTRAPLVAEFWYAQMSLWIQQDVVQALAGLNNHVADGLKSRGEDPWVGNLPVKHLQWFNVGGYLPWESSEVESVSRRGRGLGSSGSVAGGEAFTQRSGNEAIDVIRFSLGLVVEARMLPSVVDEICKAGFYTPLLVEYDAVPATTSLEDYIYGPGPAIQVELQFEGCFLRNKYDKWMPPSVKDAIREGRAVSEGASSVVKDRTMPSYPHPGGGPAGLDLEGEFGR